MQDTPSIASKEILLTSGLFFVIIIIGTFAFDLYTKTSSNQITGTVIGNSDLTGAQTYEEKAEYDAEETPIIGIYSVLPSFSIIDEYDLVEEYTTLQRDIREFYDTVEACRTEKEDSVEDCIAATLNEPVYAAWLDEESCETGEEALFYDVTEIFSQCLASEESDCLCYGILEEGKYDTGEFVITLAQEETGTQFALEGTPLSLVLPLHFEIEDTAMVSDEYTVAVTTGSAVGSFSSLEPSAVFYLYKKDSQTISVEDETTFSMYSATRSSCPKPEKQLSKFCVQSHTVVSVYDEEKDKTIQEPVVYMFAVDFSK